ncbi:PucR family transcriptional regulator ligand-binding domain-containing protein [Fodinisporobacter ferrooxydans]|uniref:PucR family transcriptional regulator ligand-binding domain-containing protein n=1 Tax=Fodinisporobacter ferrooxydans TaxID=2901836 RepID=A0ABY4CP57_9BACL|nr:PucR family transcriptional regulator ligand-binding domain-containing protein [Alicyclobacillaceae bacterium MYW30-H2]
MEVEFMLTLYDVLKRPLFQQAQVIAGKNGLHRRIRWVHVLEISNFAPFALILGEEMILTSGIGFHSGEDNLIHYMQKLIELNVSCLCVEMGEYLQFIPDEMIDIANQNNFPLIVFPKMVRFVDITLDLHPLIINGQYKMLQSLLEVSREFSRLSLTSQGTTDVIKLLHKSTQNQIIFLPLDGTPYVAPKMEHIAQNKLLNFLKDHVQILLDKNTSSPYTLKKDDQIILLQPVGAMGQTWAFIAMVSDQEPHEYHSLIIESASLSISQELLRERYMEERKLHTENLWVDDLLNDRIEDDLQIKKFVGPNYQKWNEMSCRVCIIELERSSVGGLDFSKDSLDLAGSHLSLIVRSVFKQHAFLPFITTKGNRIVILVLDLMDKAKEKTLSKERLQYVLSYINNLSLKKKVSDFQLYFGVGQTYVGFKNAHRSHDEAVKALSIRSQYNKTFIFYDDLGFFQLLIDLNEKNMLESFVHHHLGPLIKEDKAKGSDLLRTMKVYLENGGLKKQTADALHIVRQSLYYRLEKIEELLGKEFMSPENRLTIQLALYSYAFLYPNSFDIGSID